MVLTLPTATLVTGLLFLLWGGLTLANPPLWRRGQQGFPRSMAAAYLTMGLAGAWFMFRIWHLSPADFGQYRNVFLLVFGLAWLGSFVYLRDFLSVRGAAGLVLLAGWEVLKSAYGHYEHPQRLVLVTTVYVLAVVALYFGALPYRLRDLFAWLYEQPRRARALGAGAAALGLALVGIAFTY